jgi:hypothetical protein
MWITYSSWCITGVEKFWIATGCDQLVGGLIYEFNSSER